MRKKSFALILIFIFLVTVMTGCGSTNNLATIQTGNTAKYPVMKIRMTVNGTDIATDTKTALKFAELVKEGSNGNIQISVFPNDQLAGGNMTKGVEMVAQGATEIAAYATSVLGALDQRLLIGTTPWLFDNYKQAREVIDSTGGAYYEKVLSEKGLTYLGSFHNGFRQITNGKHPVKKPEDIKGLKIRIPGGEIYMDFWRAFGADPVAMSWGEVFTALQQGTIDGQENGYSITNSANIYEVQKYMTEWNYTYESDLFIFNSKKFNSYTPETQQLLRNSAKEACEWGRNTVESGEAELKQKFRDKGMEVTELSSEDLKPFKEVVAGLSKKYADKYGEEAAKAFGIK